ncbi:MAG: hypothetical protein QOC92_3392 [Acidimicrobiaceae bacterium]
MSASDRFKGTLPYASELFGIYQPLLGWKSKITAERYEGAVAKSYDAIGNKFLKAVSSPVRVKPRDVAASLASHGGASFEVENLEPIRLPDELRPRVAASIQSGIAQLIAEEVGNRPPADWEAELTYDRVKERLEELKTIIQDPRELQRHPGVQTYVETFASQLGDRDSMRILTALFDKESRTAGYLVFLAQHSPSALNQLFFPQQLDALSAIARVDPLLSFGDGTFRAVLSPIGIIHLYREYFFEFDSFLGPPVGHVWLSPGGTVELVEVNTRKVLVERTFETAVETVQRQETDITAQDELADAVKEDNSSDVKFGVTNTAKYSVKVFEDTATASFSLDQAKKTSRETTHKHMRQQSEKLSSEIKRNFKTTFRTSTEVTDTTSRRYVIANASPRLVNYELRRKMRKVGVQVQDIGVQLCWHTFVDDPGKALGVGMFVHLGEPPEMADLVHPDQPVAPTAQREELAFAIPFVGLDTDDTDNAYTDGSETEVGFLDSTEHIEPNFPQRVTFKSPGFTLTDVVISTEGDDAKISARDIHSDEGSSAGTFTAHLDYVNWHGRDVVNAKAALTWSPTQASVDAAKAQYDTKMGEYTAEKARRFKEAFIKASRERIELASQIRPRPATTLREEERTVVYRRLIRQLMGVSGAEESRHVISELVRSIFDVDKMLYFVAPEWWMPRVHRSAQHLGEEQPGPGPAVGGASGTVTTPSGAILRNKMLTSIQDALVSKASLVVETLGEGAPPRRTTIPAQDIVDWGGAAEAGRDNYYITDKSEPAKLGSSLGWLIQLDGDDLRNAMLNSPWVKAVIPIRVGKERAAMNWLRQAHVEGDDGLDAEYAAAADDPPALQSSPGHTVTVLEALEHLIGEIDTFDDHARTPVVANPADPGDASNHFAGSMPTEAVFEHGFYPLQGGVRFNQNGTEQPIFSQWTEILPTDQVAAVEVEYDPITLQVKVSPQPPRADTP